jgi:hypothetical protein
MKVPDCTLTTACFSLTKFHDKSRPLQECVQNMKGLLEIPCYLVIYSDSLCMTLIKEIRGSFGLDHLTHYVQIEFHELPKYYLLEQIKRNRESYYPTRDERTCAESHLVTISKPDFLLKTIESNPFTTTKFGWIDANLGSNNLSKVCENYENNMLLSVLNNLTDKFHIQILNVCDKKFKDPSNKREMYEQYRWIVCGCLFTTTAALGEKILSRLNENIVQQTMDGFGHSEEMFFLEILDEFYDDIYRSYGDYGNIINNFIRPTKGFHYIYHYIIHNYQNYGYYKECYDCCKCVLEEIESYRVSIDYGLYFSILFSYYLSAFYYKGKDESKLIVEHILNVMKTNPYVRLEYEKNKNFYDSNFQYALS